MVRLDQKVVLVRGEFVSAGSWQKLEHMLLHGLSYNLG